MNQTSVADPSARLPRQIPFIIGNEACERFSFYGMRNMLVQFLVSSVILAYIPEAQREGAAKDVFHSFVIGVYFFPLLGGWLADRFFGKYNTVLWFSLIYCAGHACLAMFEDNRNGFYIASDYAYNMLAPLDKNAFVFTNGDNDTFPLWCTQAVDKVRTDIRVVNLSLLNTDWYIKQLRDEEPKVPMTVTDQTLEQIRTQGYLFDDSGRAEAVNTWMVRNIMRANTGPGEKPAYLAVTVPNHMDLDKRLRLAGVAVLDGVRHQVEQHELQAGRIRDQARQIRCDTDRHPAGLSHLGKLARDFRTQLRQFDALLARHVDRIAHLRDPLQVFDQPREPVGAAAHRRRHLGQPQRVLPHRLVLEQRAGEAKRADWRAQLMAGGAVERLDPLVLFLNRGGVFADERIDGRPHQHPHRSCQPAMDAEGIGDRRLQAEAFGLLDEKALEDLPEDLVFVQQLVGGRALLVPQQPELARLVHHRGVGGNLLGLRRRQVAGDLIDEQRDVIEQLLGREHFVRRDGQELTQARQPRRRERQALGDDALPNHRGVVFRREKRHWHDTRVWRSAILASTFRRRFALHASIQRYR